MSKDLIKIKGGPNGFRLMVNPAASMADINAELLKKLAENPEFFPPGTEFELVAADLNKNLKSGLRELLSTKGLAVAEKKAQSEDVLITSERRSVNVAETASNERNASEPVQAMTVIERTVRNGEEITAQGSVMICGNVNPGAKIVAGGSIDIRGTCRGIVHAGAMGDYNAFVVADRLMPMQIRIANLIARSPDEVERSDYAEKAFIRDGQIVIEPIER